MSRTLFLASFECPRDLLAAVRDVREAGYAVVDTYVPYPIHGLDEAMGIRPSRMGWACFLFGAPACLAAFLFQSWVAAVDWPINLGGKPFFFWQAFVPVAFEFTVLCAGLGTVATLLISRGLLPGKRSDIPVMGATDARFVLAVARTDTAFDEEEFMAICRRHRVAETREHLEAA